MIAILCHSTDKPAGEAIHGAMLEQRGATRVFDETTAYEAAGAAVTVLVLSSDAFADDAIRHTAKAAHAGGTLRVFPWRALFMAGNFGISVSTSENRYIGPHLHPQDGRWVSPSGDLIAAAEAMADAVRGEIASREAQP